MKYFLLAFLSKINDSYFPKEEHYFENNLKNYSTFKPGYNSNEN